MVIGQSDAMGAESLRASRAVALELGLGGVPQAKGKSRRGWRGEKWELPGASQRAGAEVGGEGAKCKGSLTTQPKAQTSSCIWTVGC